MQHIIESRLFNTSRWALFCGAWAVLACSGAEPSPSAPTATARFELEAGTENGNVFKLEDAIFELNGPEPTTVTSDGIGPWVQVDLQAGDYSIMLKDGWRLVHTSGPAVQIDTSGATLASPNPMFVSLPMGQVTDVIFHFVLDGDVLGKGDARGRIGISVDEPLCGNGIFDDGEECDSAINYANATCDDLCTGGYRTCSGPTDCASGRCIIGDCDCDGSADACHERCQDDGSACKGACADESDTCSDGCDDSEQTCRSTCGGLSAACWASCWFDPVGCAITCEPSRAICMEACSEVRSSCDGGCQDDFDSCAGGCDSDACHAECDSGEEACLSSCNRCEDCTSAGQCPYLE